MESSELTTSPATQAESVLSGRRVEPRVTPVPTPMKLIDLPKVVRTMNESFVNDPMACYLRDTPDYSGGSTYYMSRHVEHIAMWNNFIILSRAWTVDGGAAIAAYSPATSTEGRFENLPMSLMRGAMSWCNSWIHTKEQAKRLGEVRAKVQAALHETLGDRETEVLHLRILAASRVTRGRGYGSALAQAVTGIADSQKRATVLISTNPVNTGFYQSLGFVEKGRVLLGEDNPSWQEDPIVLLVMVREPPVEHQA